MYTEHLRTLPAESPAPSVLDPTPATLLGVTVHRVTEAEIVDHVIATPGGGSIYSVNLDTLRQAHERQEIRSLLGAADIRIADGMPIVWAGRLARTPFPERVAGSNLVPMLSAKAATNNRSVYLLGGNPGVADEAAELLLKRHPELQIAGTDCPEFGFETKEGGIEAICARAIAAEPDIVFVGLGFPKQELLIEELRAAMPGAWFISCGISFSFLTGDVRRAPEWMQRRGLEWAHRFVQEPQRLFRRYFLEDLPFLVTLFRGVRMERRLRQLQGHSE